MNDKVTAVSVWKAAEEAWARGERVGYESVQSALRCRKGDLVPFMGPIFADPRQRNGVVSPNIKESLANLRKAIVADVYEQFQAEMANWVAKEEKWQAEVEVLRAALESAQTRIGELSLAFENSQTELAENRSSADQQAGKHLELISELTRRLAEQNANKERFAQVEMGWVAKEEKSQGEMAALRTALASAQTRIGELSQALEKSQTELAESRSNADQQAGKYLELISELTRGRSEQNAIKERLASLENSIAPPTILACSRWTLTPKFRA